MRWLAGLALLLAALVALLLYGTHAGHPATTGLEVGSRSSPGASARTDARVANPGVGAAAATSSDGPIAEVDVAARAAVVPRSTSIEGRVVRATGEDAENALVGLFFLARVEDSDESRYSPQPIARNADFDRARLVRSWTKSDEHGRFRFEDPDPGTWVVRAELGPLLAAVTVPFLVAAGESRVDLRVELPHEAWLEGRVILPERRTMENLCLELRARRPYSIAPWSPNPGAFEIVAERCIPDESGHFRLGPVETGLHQVGLVIDTTLAQRGNVLPFWGTVVPILELALAPGTNERDVDLRSGFPGVVGAKITVELFDPFDPARTFAANTMPSVILHMERLDGPDPREIRGFKLSDGSAQDCGPLANGVWRADAVLQLPNVWFWRLADAIPLDAGARFDIERTLRVPCTRVQFVNAASGLPLAEGELVQIGDPTRNQPSWRETDAEGRIDLALPPGEYVVTARDVKLADLAFAPQSWTRLEWHATGPSSTVVRLPCQTPTEVRTGAGK